MTTCTEILARQLRTDPGRPLVTYYDEATGERVELSVTTYANWVAKVSSLLVEEHDLERGGRLRVDLPAHWLTTVFLGAAWTIGLVVVDESDDAPDAVVCGPATVGAWGSRAAELPVLACSLLPLGVRFADPVPPGVQDVGVDVWSQPDAYVAWDPPTGDDLAHRLGGGSATQDQMWESAAAGALLADGGRLLSEANPALGPSLATLTEPLARGGSLVLVAGAGRGRLDAIAAAERVTARFPAP